MNRLVSLALATIALVAVAACSSGSNGRAVEPSLDPDALTIAAKDLKFSTSTLSAPADEPFQIVFDNQEGAPHNVAIYRDARRPRRSSARTRSAGRPSLSTRFRRWRRARTSSGATCIRTCPASSPPADRSRLDDHRSMTMATIGIGGVDSDPYARLGLAPGASIAEVKRAYRRPGEAIPSGPRGTGEPRPLWL